MCRSGCFPCVICTGISEQTGWCGQWRVPYSLCRSTNGFNLNFIILYENPMKIRKCRKCTLPRTRITIVCVTVVYCCICQQRTLRNATILSCPLEQAEVAPSYQHKVEHSWIWRCSWRQRSQISRKFLTREEDRWHVWYQEHISELLDQMFHFEMSYHARLLFWFMSVCYVWELSCQERCGSFFCIYA